MKAILSALALLLQAQTGSSYQKWIDTKGDVTVYAAQIKPVVDVRDSGVVGDGQVAVDCSITTGTAIVTCATAHFVPGDAGKVVGMWQAGPAVFKNPNTYITALTSTIQSYQSPTQVTLADTAGSTANPSPHFVWGTNNYTALNTAIATANTKYPNGYNLFFPAGYYLTPSVQFPCGAIGTFGTYICTTATKNVTVSGISATSATIENFKADRGSKGGNPGECATSTYTCGLIMFGWMSTGDGLFPDSAHWVNGVTIHDLTLIEVDNGNGTFFNEPQNIVLGGTSNSEVYNTNLQQSSYMCIGGGNEPAYIHDNYAYHCGWGGPAYSGSNSAINVVVPNSKTVRNRIYYSAQGIEGGAPNQEISDNFIEADDTHGNYPPVSVSPITGLNIGSATYGMWNTLVARNTLLNWATHGSSGNVFNTGIMANMIIEDNTFINSGAFLLGFGGEGPATGWPSGEIPPDIHGTSIFRHNVFRYDKGFTVTTQGIGISLRAQTEKWIVDDNDIVLPGNSSNCTSCVGIVLQQSFQGWQATTTYTQNTNSPSYVQPVPPNGFYYVPVGASGTCITGSVAPTFPTIINTTVIDGTCTWNTVGVKPVQIIANTHISFPSGSTNASFAIQNQGMLAVDFLIFNLTNSGATVGGTPGIQMTVNGWSLTGFPQGTFGPPSVVISSQKPYNTN